MKNRNIISENYKRWLTQIRQAQKDNELILINRIRKSYGKEAFMEIDDVILHEDITDIMLGLIDRDGTRIHEVIRKESTFIDFTVHPKIAENHLDSLEIEAWLITQKTIGAALGLL